MEILKFKDLPGFVIRFSNKKSPEGMLVLEAEHLTSKWKISQPFEEGLDVWDVLVDFKNNLRNL